MYASVDGGRGTGLAAGLPEIDDPEAVEALAARVVAGAEAVVRTAEELRARWRGLATSYDAPEANDLSGAMDSATHLAGQLDTDVTVAAGALRTFSRELEDLRHRRAVLVADIGRAQTLWKAYYAADPTELVLGYPGHGGGTTVAEQARLSAEQFTRGVSKRIARLREDLARAELECGTALRRIHGAECFHLGGHASVYNEHQYGLDADDFLAAWRDGRCQAC